MDMSKNKRNKVLIVVTAIGAVIALLANIDGGLSFLERFRSPPKKTVMKRYKPKKVLKKIQVRSKRELKEMALVGMVTCIVQVQLVKGNQIVNIELFPSESKVPSMYQSTVQSKNGCVYSMDVMFRSRKRAKRPDYRYFALYSNSIGNEVKYVIAQVWERIENGRRTPKVTFEEIGTIKKSNQTDFKRKRKQIQKKIYDTIYSHFIPEKIQPVPENRHIDIITLQGAINAGNPIK